MSRHEQEREELLREATALVERVELVVAGQGEAVFVGFRQEAGASFYFGQDRVYHFNAAGQLRRAYLDGKLYKAHQGRLIALERRRTASETALLSQEQSPKEAAAILANLQALLTELELALSGGTFTIAGQVPSGTNIVSRIRDWLGAHLRCVTIAERANVA